MSIKVKFHYLPIPGGTKKSQSIIYPSKTKPELEAVITANLRTRVLVQFRALMGYIGHYRGGKIHPNLQQAVSEILLRMSQWKSTLKETNDLMILSQIELNLQLGVYELEAVEKWNDLTKIMMELEKTGNLAKDKVVGIGNILNHGFTNQFGQKSESPEIINCREKLHQALETLKNPKLTPHELISTIELSKECWKDLNYRVTYDFRIYSASRTESLHDAGILWQFLINYQSLLSQIPGYQEAIDFCESCPIQITPVNLEDINFALGDFRDKWIRNAEKGQEEVQTTNEFTIPLTKAFIDIFSQAQIPFSPIETSSQSSLFQLTLPKSGDQWIVDLSTWGEAIFQGSGPRESLFLFFEDLYPPFLKKYGIEWAPVL